MKSLIFKFICFFLILLSCSDAQAQLTDEKLKDLAREKVDRYTILLHLTATEQKKMSAIIYDYDKRISDLIKLGPVSPVVIRKNNDEKLMAIEDLLSRRDYENFLIFEKMDQKSGEEYFDSFTLSVSDNEEIVRELGVYAMANIFPVISKFRVDFDELIDEKDHKRIEELKNVIYDDLMTKEVLEGSEKLKFDEFSIARLREVARIGSTYQQDFSKMQTALKPHSDEWKKEIKLIFDKYFVESQMSGMDKVRENLAKNGFLNSIGLIGFILLEPYQANRFYKNMVLTRFLRKQLAFIE